MGRKVWFPVVSGPLEPFAAGFALWLASRAYWSMSAKRWCPIFAAVRGARAARCCCG